MYHGHFRLSGQPFTNTPDIGLFFAGAERGSVLEALLYAIEQGDALIKVVGEVGTGKTMLCRMVEARLPETVEVVYLANPSLTPDNILHAIALELKLPVDFATNKLAVLHALQRHLLALHAEHKQVVLLVEEAQCMPEATLEEIRLLSNLETNQHKLVQIVLFGQPELDKKLAQSGLRQLTERIAHSFYLEPFTRSDVREYVRFRVAKRSEWQGWELFSPLALHVLHQVTHGLARRVNFVADKALLAAFADHANRVKVRHVWRAARDCQFGRAATHRRTSFKVTAVVLLLVGLAWAARPLFHGGDVGNDDSTQALIEYATAAWSGAVGTQTPTVTPRATLPGTVDERAPGMAENALDPRLADLITATARMADGADSSTYTIQVMTTYVDRPTEIHGLLRLLDAAGQEPLYVHPGTMRGRPVLVLSYGTYAGYSQAKEAVAAMPTAFRRFQPLARTLDSLRTELRS